MREHLLLFVTGHGSSCIWLTECQLRLGGQWHAVIFTAAVCICVTCALPHGDHFLVRFLSYLPATWDVWESKIRFSLKTKRPSAVCLPTSAKLPHSDLQKQMCPEASLTGTASHLDWGRIWAGLCKVDPEGNHQTNYTFT